MRKLRDRPLRNRAEEGVTPRRSLHIPAAASTNHRFTFTLPKSSSKTHFYHSFFQKGDLQTFITSLFCHFRRVLRKRRQFIFYFFYFYGLAGFVAELNRRKPGGQRGGAREVAGREQPQSGHRGEYESVFKTTWRWFLLHDFVPSSFRVYFEKPAHFLLTTLHIILLRDFFISLSTKNEAISHNSSLYYMAFITFLFHFYALFSSLLPSCLFYIYPIYFYWSVSILNQLTHFCGTLSRSSFSFKTNYV